MPHLPRRPRQPRREGDGGATPGGSADSDGEPRSAAPATPTSSAPPGSPSRGFWGGPRRPPPDLTLLAWLTFAGANGTLALLLGKAAGVDLLGSLSLGPTSDFQLAVALMTPVAALNLLIMWWVVSAAI